jgi:electron transport complex protein RnfG
MGKQIKFFFEQSWLLLFSAVLFGLCLASLNAWWQPKIIANEIKKFNDLAGAMIADANDFSVAVAKDEFSVDVKGKDVPTEIKKARDKKGAVVGWAFIAEGAGFQDKIRLVVALDKEFDEMEGFGVLSSNETPGFGDKMKKDKFRNQFVNAPTEDFTLSKTGDRGKIDCEIIAITGATVTSDAVVEILDNYIEQVRAELEKRKLIKKKESTEDGKDE